MQELREDSSDELNIPGNALELRLTLLLRKMTLYPRQLSPIGTWGQWGEPALHVTMIASWP